MKKYIILVLFLVILGTLKIGVIKGAVENQAVYNSSYPYLSGSALVNQSPITSAVRRVEVRLTAYSSRPEETDDTPFITAAGTPTRPGVVAANWLPLGTRIRIPEIFGDKIFIVEDRMHPRHSDKLDIWFPSTEEALLFGTKVALVEIL